MVRVVKILLAASAMLAITSVSHSTTLIKVTVTCPIGGKKFQSYGMASNSYFGQRPDGRPYSPSPIPFIDECPDNGFVIFDTKFTTAEIATLTRAIASPDYQVMRDTQSRHYRAWWLMGQINRNAYSRAIALLTASWEVDDAPERKAEYQAAFVSAAAALVFADSHRDDWLWLRLRAANALRELGRFDDSTALLDQTDIEHHLPADSSAKIQAQALADGLRLLNRDQNRHPEPANLIPPMVALDRCEALDLSAAETQACRGKEIKAARTERRKWSKPPATSHFKARPSLDAKTKAEKISAAATAAAEAAAKAQ